MLAAPGGELLGDAAEALLAAIMRHQPFHLALGLIGLGGLADQRQQPLGGEVIDQLRLRLGEASLMQHVIDLRVDAQALRCIHLIIIGRWRYAHGVTPERLLLG